MASYIAAMAKFKSEWVRIDGHTAARLREVKELVDRLHDRGTLSAGKVVSLLLDHWHCNPPNMSWVKGQANLYGASRGEEV